MYIRMRSYCFRCVPRNYDSCRYTIYFRAGLGIVIHSSRGLMGIVNVAQVNIDVEGEADNEEHSEESHRYRRG